MEIIQIQAFINLAQTLHMSSTAQELNTSQSHISKLISSLESELGAKLFDRVGHKLVLNEHGKLFYPYASEALHQMDGGRTALKSVSQKILGTINIRCYAFSYILSPCITAFAKENPLANIYLSDIDQLESNYLANSTDFILTTARSGSSSYRLNAYFPESRVLFEEGFCAVFSPKLLRLPADTKLSLNDLAQHPLIENATPSYYDNPIFRNEHNWELGEHPLTNMRIGYLTNDFYSKVRLTDEGLGFALFPEACIPSVLQIAPELQVFPLSGSEVYRRRVLIAHKGLSRMNEASRCFWEFLNTYFDQHGRPEL
ncbi:MAG: LysR family transcriptional regulator [Lachnospiraceae bacterium]|nr:LysR family transcriptional regulator [Lachnospiraceae bacterium]